MSPPQDSYRTAGLIMGYAARFLLLFGLAILGASLFLRTGGWLLGVVLLVMAVFMVAIAYALNLPG